MTNNIPPLVRILAFRAWVALSAIWIVGTLALTVWAGVSLDKLLSLPYLMFVFGPSIGLFILWHVVAWIISPMLPRQPDPLAAPRRGMTTNKKVALGLATAYVLLWAVYYYTNAPDEDFARHGAPVVLMGAVAGAFGGLFALIVTIVLPIALLFWVFGKLTKKNAPAIENTGPLHDAAPIDEVQSK